MKVHPVIHQTQLWHAQMAVVVVFASLLVPFSVFGQIYDNGPLINNPGGGVGGADESVLQDVTLGMSAFGFPHQVLNNNSIADDFTVYHDTWTIDSLVFFAYQSFSSTTSSITEVRYRIWDGPPNAGGTVIFGDLTTNRMIGTRWSNIYRVNESTTGGNTDRPIMANTCSGGAMLGTGSYWIEWQTNGTLSSGPWAPPITINGMTTTGGGLQSIAGTWDDARDPGTGTQQGFPFLVYGTATGGGEPPWMVQTSGTSEDLLAVYFTDSYTGWIVGSGGTILHTTDAGITWVAQTSGTTDVLISVFFIDSYTGWAVGGLGGPTILKTTDGGNTWSALVGGVLLLQSVHFTDVNTGWTVGDAGWMHHTTDGGLTWDFSRVSDDYLESVYFIDASTGWAVGSSGTILNTTDGGITWALQSSGTSDWLYSVFFADANTGWVVGGADVILSTTNGGSIWDFQASGVTRPLPYSVHFTDLIHGWIVGGEGTILHTTNSGGTWMNQLSGRTETLSGVNFADSNTGWAVGQFGTILHTTTGGTVWTQSETMTLPREHLLRQNYPNPFNPSTTIDFALPRSSHVKLEMYNILGERVSVLRDGVQDAGYHSVVFEAEGLPSGIYFYRLQAGSFVETKKLIVLR